MRAAGKKQRQVSLQPAVQTKCSFVAQSITNNTRKDVRHGRQAWQPCQAGEGSGRTKLESALDDGHFGINDAGPALQELNPPQTLDQVLQQIPQQLPLRPAVTRQPSTSCCMLKCVQSKIGHLFDKSKSQSHLTKPAPCLDSCAQPSKQW